MSDAGVPRRAAMVSSSRSCWNADHGRARSVNSRFSGAVARVRPPRHCSPSTSERAEEEFLGRAAHPVGREGREATAIRQRLLIRSLYGEGVNVKSASATSSWRLGVLPLCAFVDQDSPARLVDSRDQLGSDRVVNGGSALSVEVKLRSLSAKFRLRGTSQRKPESAFATW